MVELQPEKQYKGTSFHGIFSSLKKKPAKFCSLHSTVNKIENNKKYSSGQNGNWRQANLKEVQKKTEKCRSSRTQGENQPVRAQ